MNIEKIETELRTAHKELINAKSAQFLADQELVRAKRALIDRRHALQSSGLIEGKNDKERDASFAAQAVDELFNVQNAEAEAAAEAFVVSKAELDWQLARNLVRLFTGNRE